MRLPELDARTHSSAEEAEGGVTWEVWILGGGGVPQGVVWKEVGAAG